MLPPNLPFEGPIGGSGCRTMPPRSIATAEHAQPPMDTSVSSIATTRTGPPGFRGQKQGGQGLQVSPDIDVVHVQAERNQGV